MGDMVYLNNFPREKALKGQKFEGASVLKAELLERGIIGDSDKLEVEGFYKKDDSLSLIVEALEAKIKKLENQKINSSDEKLSLELEAVKTENKTLFEAGEDMAKEIEKLNAALKESKKVKG